MEFTINPNRSLIVNFTFYFEGLARKYNVKNIDLRNYGHGTLHGFINGNVRYRGNVPFHSVKDIDYSKLFMDACGLEDYFKNSLKEYQMILYLQPDIVENVIASNAEDAKRIVLEKLRKMSNEELLENLSTSIRECSRYTIWDDKGVSVGSGEDITI